VLNLTILAVVGATQLKRVLGIGATGGGDR